MKKIALTLCTLGILAQAEFIRNDNKNVVIDTDRKLMWQDEEYSRDEKYNYDYQREGGKVLKWANAGGYCSNLSLSGFYDWRLPSKDEMISILSACYISAENSSWASWNSANSHKKTSNSYLREPFKHTGWDYQSEAKGGGYWSSTVSATNSADAWAVGSGYGGPDAGAKTFTSYIRCVRDVRDYELTNNSPTKVVKKAPKQTRDTTPPTISISSPSTDRALKLSSTDSTVDIIGIASDNVGVNEVSINGEPAALDANGNFSFQARTKIGENIFEIIATDTSGNETKKSVKVTRSSAITKVQKPQKSNSSDTGELGNVGKYYALIIGVQNYDDSEIHSLEFPIKDAKRFATTLNENYRFDRIIPLHNPTRADILGALEKLADEIKPSDNLLIFYAGHGYWDEKISQGYWLPRDAKKKSKASWLSNSELKDYLAGIKSHHTLLVSDACFGGSIFKTRNAFDEDKSAKALYELSSRIAMTSGALKEVPDKSVFLDYMIKRLGTNNKKLLSSSSLFSSFREAVISASPNHQVPQYGAVQVEGNEGGDFIFIRK